MAGPFGGHPTLQTYLTWLRGQGFNYKTGYVDLDDRSIPLVSVQNAKGEDVFIIGDVDMSDHLAPSQVEYYDSVFGVSSPYPKPPK